MRGWGWAYVGHGGLSWGQGCGGQGGGRGTGARDAANARWEVTLGLLAARVGKVGHKDTVLWDVDVSLALL